jgi:arsenate reductase (thioredoxin)
MHRPIFFTLIFTLSMAVFANGGAEGGGTSPGNTSAENSSSESGAASALYPAVHSFFASLGPEMEAISEARREQLGELAAVIRELREQETPLALTFICTHNSRRSHLGQVLSMAAAAYTGVEGLQAYSGGTEATAFNPRAVAAIERIGFQVENPGGNNPHYQVRYAESAAPLTCFSKKYDHEANPREGFIAVMVCSEADAACPFVPGADARLAIPYLDPKASDGSPEEAATYDARTRQIAAEMLYAMQLVSKK